MEDNGRVMDEEEFHRDVIRELWGRLEERYEEARLEATLVEWAARAIKRSPETYSPAERLSWACRAVWLVEELSTLEGLWKVVCEADGNSARQGAASRDEHRKEQWPPAQ